MIEFKAEVLVVVRGRRLSYDPPQREVGQSLSRRFLLPFVPFPGLCLLTDNGCYIVRRVAWHDGSGLSVGVNDIESNVALADVDAEHGKIIDRLLKDGWLPEEKVEMM